MASPRPSLKTLYLNRRVGIMLPLGFASGLPLALTGDTLAAWATAAGVSLKEIGLLSYVTLPYVLKFLWAPLLDRYALPFLDRRRSWALLFQLSLIAAIGVMAMYDPIRHPWILASMAMLVALLSASQDICLDAYRTDTLAPEQRGSGVAMYVSGYRLGMILSGALPLILVGHGLSWSAVYLLMAASMSVAAVATVLAPPAPAEAAAPATLEMAVVEPLWQILCRPTGWLVLLFVILFKVPDTLANVFTTTFLMKIHIPLQDIGWYRQTFGLVVTILGTLAGGALVGKLSLRNSMWIAGILQPATNAGFLLLNLFPASRPLLLGVIGVESFAAGLVNACFGAFLMAQCDRRFSAFQFALLTSAMALPRIFAAAPAGSFAEAYGWSAFFTLTIAVAYPGLLLLPFLPMQAEEQEELPAAAPADAQERR